MMLDPNSQPQRPSSVYTLLPSMLQSRISKFPFLRRSASTGAAKSFYCSARNRQRTTDHSKRADACPPSLDQRPPSSLSDDRHLPCHSDTEDVDSVDNEVFSLPDRPSLASAVPSVNMVLDQSDGIVWRYANQGLSLLLRAFQERSSVPEAIDNTSRSFSRQLYIHALTYLLRGLPPDLTSEEKVSICSALPRTVVNSDQAFMSGWAAQRQRSGQNNELQAESIEPSALHRILASCIIQTFLLIQLILPYLRLVAYSAYRFERENRVSERLFSSTINTIDEIGKRSLRYTDAVCKLNDGRMGEALTEFAGWWIREIAGGVHEGLIEGMAILGAPRIDYRQMRGQMSAPT